MAVGFVVGCLRALRNSKSIKDLRKPSNVKLAPPTSLRSLSSASNEDDFPPPPKKPLSPYMLFLQEKRQETYGKDSKVSAKDQVKALAGKWRDLGQVDKQIYSEKYKQNLAEYTKAHESYLKTLSLEQHQALLERFRLRKENIHHRKMKSQLQMLKKPVGARNSFSFFVAKEASSVTGGTNAPEIIKELSSRWKELPKEEKEKYRKLAEDDQIRYRSEMTSWTKKMIDEGHSNLLEMMTKRKTRKVKNPGAD